MNNHIKNNIIKFIYLFVGFIFFFNIIYVRFILVRIPKKLEMFVPIINWPLILLATTWVLLSLYLIIKNISFYYKN